MQRLLQTRRGGQPLDTATRDFMEPRFGHDFSSVHLHTDAVAGEMAQRLQARAFTIGDDIFFGPGQFELDRSSGKRLLAHELAHVVQQTEASHAPHIQRSPKNTGLEEWAITSSVKPLPGVPAPGYEQGRVSYTEADRNALLDLLNTRDEDNLLNVGAFVGEYGAAIIDLWTRYATEAMAKAAEDAGWSTFDKLLKFVLTESLLALSGFWVAAKLGHLGAELVKVGIAATTEIGSEAAQGAAERTEVEASRAAIDARTRLLAERFKALSTHVHGQIGKGVSYTSWLLKADLSELGRFRIPPAFPFIPIANVRAAVAQAIVGLLHGPERPRARVGKWGASMGANVIIMEVEPEIGRQFRVTSDPRINASGVLASELYGHRIGEMPKIPLHITLASRESPTAAVRRMGIPLLYDPKEAAEQERLRYMTESAVRALGPAKPDAFVAAYPSKAPATITRDLEGSVEVSGGGLLEHLFLYGRATGGNLESLIGEIMEERRIQAMEEAGNPVFGPLPPSSTRSELPSAEELAREVHRHMLLWKQAGARALITQNLELLPLKKPLPERRR